MVADNPQVPPPRRRRSKAEIEADNRREESEKALAAAAELRKKIALGEGREAKVAAAILAVFSHAWPDIQNVPKFTITVSQCDTNAMAEINYTKPHGLQRVVSFEETPNLL